MRKSGLVVVALLLAVVWDSVFLLPLRVLVVVFHEGGHALAALATGGSVERMTVGLDEGGMTVTRGGSEFLILNGGYLGSLLVGVGLLLVVGRAGAGRAAVAVMGALLTLSAALWFRPVLSFGFAYALGTGLLLSVAAAKAPEWVSDGLVRVVGVFGVIYALLDIKSDVFRFAHVSLPWSTYSGPSDAERLAELTGVPAMAWGAGWLVAGIALLWVLRKRLG